MSILNKILLTLIGLAALAFFYFGMLTLKTHQQWRSAACARQYFIEREKELGNLFIDGGKTLTVGGEEELEELRKFYKKPLAIFRKVHEERARNKAGNHNKDVQFMPFRVEAGMQWWAFRNEVLWAVDATGHFDERLVDKCVVRQPGPLPTKLDPAPEPLAIFRFADPLAAVAPGGDAAEAQDVIGIRQIRLDLHALLIDRGRVWFNCTPQGAANPQTGEVLVKTMLPRPHRILNNSVMYVFEENEVQKPEPEKGHYIGRFRVVKITNEDDEVALKPLRTWTGRQLQRLAASRGPWTMYETMPIDNHFVFAGLKDEQLQAMLPKASLPEYLKDGEGTYLRRLRAYQILFSAFDVQRTVLLDLIESDTRDLLYVKNTYKDTQVQIRLRDAAVVQMTALKAKLQRERDAAAAHHKVLAPRVAALQASIKKLVAANKAMAARIAQIQKDATKLIDQRTRRMAQTRAAGS